MYRLITDEFNAVENTGTQPAEPLSGKSRRGFASMDPARRRELARKGGRQAQGLGKAHRFTSEEAKVAGRKGREARIRKRPGAQLMQEEQSADVQAL